MRAGAAAGAVEGVLRDPAPPVRRAPGPAGPRSTARSTTGDGCCWCSRCWRRSSPCVISKVADLQVINPGHYLAWGEAQRLHTQTLAAQRGEIVDRNGAELAVSRPAKSVYVDPALIDRPVRRGRPGGAPARPRRQRGHRQDGGEGPLRLPRPQGRPRGGRPGRRPQARRAWRSSTRASATCPRAPRPWPPSVSPTPTTRACPGSSRSTTSSSPGRPGRSRSSRTPPGGTIADGEHDVTPAVPGDDPQAHHRPVHPDRGRADPRRRGARRARPRTGVAIVMQAGHRRDPRHGRHGDRPEDRRGQAEPQQRRGDHPVRAGLGHEAGHHLDRPRGRRRHPDHQLHPPADAQDLRRDDQGGRGRGARSSGTPPRSSPTPRTSAPSPSPRRLGPSASTTACARSGSASRPGSGSRTRSRAW